MKASRLVILAACALSSASFAAEKVPTKLWVEGDSTVRQFRCDAKSVTTEVSGVENVSTIDQLSKASLEGSVKVLVFSLDCANQKMNEHMRDALKMRQHPEIKLTLKAVELGARSGDKVAISVPAELRLGGQTKAIVLKGQARESAKGLQVLGSHTLKMTDYGIKPPSLMLGTMNVHDEVKIGFDISLDRSAAKAAQASVGAAR